MFIDCSRMSVTKSVTRILLLVLFHGYPEYQGISPVCYLCMCLYFFNSLNQSKRIVDIKISNNVKGKLK